MYLKMTIGKMLKNRICIMFASVCAMFFVLFCRLYHLQILRGEEYASKIKVTTVHKMPISAQRGEIFDRHGRPLAINQASLRVKVNLSLLSKDLNQELISFFHLMDTLGCSYLDELEITEERPYSFTFSSKAAEKRWKKDMGMSEKQWDSSAEQTLRYLEGFFEIPSEHLTEKEKRRLISARSKIYLQRFRKYNEVTLADDVTPELIAALEERKEEFPGIYVDTDSLRVYPEGESMSHILGYVGSINEKELEEYGENGYASGDVIGKLGIEKSCELKLRGQEGEELIEIDAMGRKIRSIEGVLPKQGEDVYLTIDSQLQKKTQEILKESLKSVLLSDMDSGKTSVVQVLQGLVQSNTFSLKKVMSATPQQEQNKIKSFVLGAMPDLDLNEAEDVEEAKEWIKDSIAAGRITAGQMLLCFYEQGKISLDEESRKQLQNNRNVYQILKDKIVADEFTVSDVSLDPCTGSAAVVDVHSGEVLSLVTYPSYDNNRLVNQFDNAYYQTLLNDPNTPLINRPLMERKAPGSIAKMIFAVAGLETGMITEKSVIVDEGIYKQAGSPFAKCLIYSNYGITHGNVDVKKAIEVSCNYFFYDLAYRFGNAKKGTTLKSIEVLDEYMRKFGLDQVSGVEIEESRPKMATPEAKEKAILALDKNATVSQQRWTDGDSIRCAIGQSYNSFTVMHMAKYIATLANGGTRYQSNLIKGFREKGEAWDNRPPIVEEELSLQKDTVETVQEGMRLVTTGKQGTLRKHFSDYPILVGAKTGTAEEAKSRPSHSWFAGFAPYDDPQIAVVVMVPFGETPAAPAIKVGKDIISTYMGIDSEPQIKSSYENKLMK